MKLSVVIPVYNESVYGRATRDAREAAFLSTSRSSSSTMVRLMAPETSLRGLRTATPSSPLPTSEIGEKVRRYAPVSTQPRVTSCSCRTRISNTTLTSIHD